MIIVEKPHDAKRALDFIKDEYFLSFNIRNYKFNYDQEIISDQKYKINNDDFCLIHKDKDKVCYMKINGIDNLKKIIKDEEEIIFLNLDRYRTVRSNDLFIKLLELKNKFSNGHNPTYSEENTLKYYNERMDYSKSKIAKEFRQIYIKKDYINYNFNKLTMKFFNEMITINMVKTLIHMKSLNINTKEQLFLFMRKNSIGSPISLYRIIEQLYEFNLINNIGDKVVLTEKCYNLIDSNSFIFNLQKINKLTYFICNTNEKYNYSNLKIYLNDFITTAYEIKKY